MNILSEFSARVSRESSLLVVDNIENVHYYIYSGRGINFPVDDWKEIRWLIEIVCTWFCPQANNPLSRGNSHHGQTATTEMFHWVTITLWLRSMDVDKRRFEDIISVWSVCIQTYARNQLTYRTTNTEVSRQITTHTLLVFRLVDY